MKELFLKFLIRLLPFTLVLIVIHYLLIQNLDGINFYYSLPAIYLFHVLATLVIYLALVFIYIKYQEYTGYTFMGASLLKMLAAVLFLLPMLLQKPENPFLNIISFFIPYFLYLIFETIYAVKLINSK